MSFSLLLILAAIFLSSCASTQTPARQHDRSAQLEDQAAHKYAAGKWNDAVRLARLAVDADSSNRTARLLLARGLIADERYQDALFVAKDFPFESGLCNYHLERFNEAIIELGKVAGADSNYAAGLFYLGQTFVAMGNIADAVRAFRLVPDSSGDWKLQANAQLRRINGTISRKVGDSLWNEAAASRRVTRGQWAVLVCYVLNIPPGSSSQERLADIPSDHPLYPYVQPLLQGGSLERLPDNRFYPGYEMKRRNVAYYIWRMAGSETAAGDISRWKDVPQNDWLTDAIRWAAVKNLVLPLRSDYFGADESLSGREAISILNAFKPYWQRIHGQ